eukprot:TRINITY_DN20251_c0_g4_i1.p1 TRINITY_DN20251_c0_g4~~TRINITY_DN20251_c0_g4_i1.p1  ORF type:complete len:618 (-),score=68.99 TRINITY_DN20251_c0_g4_i1:13-1659(-)
MPHFQGASSQPLQNTYSHSRSGILKDAVLDSLLNAMHAHFAELNEDNRRAERVFLAQLQTIENQVQRLTSCVETHVIGPQHVGAAGGTVDKCGPENFSTDQTSNTLLSVCAKSTDETIPNFTNCGDDGIHNNNRQNGVAESEKESNRGSDDTLWAEFKSEVFPALVVLSNAVVIGISTDNAPDSLVWTGAEWGFASFYIWEILLKIYLHGVTLFVTGNQSCWNIFDSVCAVISLIDFGITVNGMVVGATSAEISAFTVVKMVRLARFLRTVRLMRYAIFAELKSLIMGLLCGFRVLLWAQVLLAVIIYIGGIVMTQLVGEFQPEFRSLPASMFTLYRCFTDGCSAYDGTPLHERLRREYGAAVFFTWILSHVFVTLGIFNLIMAVFVEHISDSQSVQQRIRLGENTSFTKRRLEEAMVRLCLRNSQIEHGRKISWSLKGSNTMSYMNISEIEGHKRDLEKCQHVRVTRDDFKEWLLNDNVAKIMKEAEIDMSSQSEIFDVLDTDSNGYLTFRELVDGIMSLRGPIRKTEIVAIRLATSHMISRFGHRV